MKRYPVDRLAAAAQLQHDQGRSWTNLAHDAGFASGRILCVALGIYSTTTTSHGKRYTYRHRTIAPDKALKVVLALGLDPVDYGL